MNREILKIALPAIVTNVTIPLLGLLDTAVSGHLDPTRGAAFIGAVSVGAMMFNLIYWNLGFLRMGTSGMTAQAFGRGHRGESATVLGYATLMAAGIGLGIILLQWPLQWLAMLAIDPSPGVRGLAITYFHIGVWGTPATLMSSAVKGWFLGMQDSRSPMVISIGENVANIVLSLALVYLAGMGFKGIILGTVLAQWGGFLYAAGLLRRKHPAVVAMLNLSGLRDKRFAKRFFLVNSNIFLRSSLIMLVTLFVMAVGARKGDMVLAVNSLIMQLLTLFSYFMDGVAFAGEAVVGKYDGRGDRQSERSCVRHLFAWAIALTVVASALYALFPRAIFATLTSDMAVVDASMRYRWWVAAIPVAGMAAFVWDGVFIGLTRTRPMLMAMAVAVAAFFAIYGLTPSTMGNHGLWLAFVCYLSIRGLVQTVQYTLFRR